ncbi:MAG: hypothetical protein ACO24Y_08580, partial [Hylemonella sp.]
IVGVGTTFTLELSLPLAELTAIDEPSGKLPITAAGMTNFDKESHLLDPLTLAPASDSAKVESGQGPVSKSGQSGH